jgi:SpoVK/Ycf46/Vps4 family AAA+-type ATPase
LKNQNHNNIDSQLEKDLEIMKRLLEKYKIIYLDSFYFKRDNKIQEAIESNLRGQEYVEKFINIISNKENQLAFNEFLNSAYNLKKQFQTLMGEIQVASKKRENEFYEYVQYIKEEISNQQIDINIKNTNQNSSVIINNDFNKEKIQQNIPNIPNDILEKIKSEILNIDTKIKFDDVFGLDKVKQALREIIIIPSIRPDLFTGLRTPAKGLLFFGPPGTGKTLIAKAVATECKCTFFNISASSLTSKYVGESEKMVKALFTVAHLPQYQPSIIFIDEIESILSKRSDGENEASKRLKTEFLIQFDGVATNSKDRVLVIGATNRPQDLDSAVLRRLPKKIFVGPMDLIGREHFIKEVMKKEPNNLSKSDLQKISEKTENYSNSDLKELCRQACTEPIRELKTGQIEKIVKLREIELNDFLKAIKAVRGTLSKEILKEYDDWNKDNGAIN